MKYFSSSFVLTPSIPSYTLLFHLYSASQNYSVDTSVKCLPTWSKVVLYAASDVFVDADNENVDSTLGIDVIAEIDLVPSQILRLLLIHSVNFFILFIMFHFRRKQ